MANVEPIEEQTLSKYRQKRYYPVRIGDLLNKQYRILAKLGYGAYSTVWLTRDENSDQYTALKVCVRDEQKISPILNEVHMLQHLAKTAIQEEHPGQQFTRLARDIFEVDGPTGRHYCIAMDPQGSSLRSLQEAFPNASLPSFWLRPLIQRLSTSLNWLHTTCHVIHTDISASNILLQGDSQMSCKAIENKEAEDPSTPGLDDGYPVYKSRVAFQGGSEVPLLGDFGSMRPLNPPNNDWWMPDIYRAPEILLHLPWGPEVDMWSMGVMILELLEGRNLFDPMDRANNQYVLPVALAQYIGYLGLPPPKMLLKSLIFEDYFDQDGCWASDPPIPKTSLDDFVTTIPAGKEKEQFMTFIRKLLTWDPEERATSYDILQDEWLMTPFG